MQTTRSVNYYIQQDSGDARAMLDLAVKCAADFYREIHDNSNREYAFRIHNALASCHTWIDCIQSRDHVETATRLHSRQRLVDLPCALEREEDPVELAGLTVKLYIDFLGIAIFNQVRSRRCTQR